MPKKIPKNDWLFHENKPSHSYLEPRPNDLYFWRSTPQNKAFSNQNKGHLGSRYIISLDTSQKEEFE